MVLEMIITILVDLITDPIKQYIVTPIKRHTSYAFSCDSKVQKLQHEVVQLQNKRDRLQQSVHEASRNGEEIFPNVTEWLSTVEKDIEEAEELIQGKEDAKKKCSVGFCPNLKTRYQLSKKADKKALAIDMLQNAQGLHPIAFRPPPQPIVEPSMYSREALPSRVLILNHIMDALKDPNLNMIGVYGMGGVGKTTFAKEVLGQAAEQKLFETVILVAVSQAPELRIIQGEIADSLGLKFDAEEVPGRASQLHHRLKQAKVLIILDDLWQKLDLSAVGVPFGDACEGCKILVTSRRKDVLSNEMCTQKEFPLDVLEEEETWRLFQISVSKAQDPELHAIAIEVAKRCAGLPLLVLKVAIDLRNKDSYAWSDMLNRLSSLENTEIYEKVHKVIESSYEKLIDEEAKSVFLLCALFGSSNIRIQNLLFYSMGLGLFKHLDSIEGARNRVLTLIDKLRDECLLLDGDSVGFVKIHDVVRDIALAIASRVQHAFVGTSKVTSTDLQKKDHTKISLPYCDISELPSVLECPKAEVFLLFMEDLCLDIPNSFFEGATNLKVVDLIRVGFVSGILPSSLGCLTSLQTLSLHKCLFNDVSIVGELKQLQLLSFEGSDIIELPRELKALTRLNLLNLNDCFYLKVIPAYVLSNLCLLEELYILNGFDKWDAEGNASVVELKNLSHLTTLEIQVQDGKLVPEDWFFNGIRKYKISVGHWRWHLGGRYESSRMLQLQLEKSIGFMNRIEEFFRGVEVLYLGEVNGMETFSHESCRDNLNSLENIHPFGKLRILIINKFHTLKTLLPFSCAKCLLQLEEIEFEDCDNMEAIVGEAREDEVMEFAQLSSLKLTSLPRLISFCKTSGTVSFPNLTSLEVSKCNSLKYVFTTSTVKSLTQLIKLEISDCESIEEIILGKKFEEMEGESIDTIVFPALEFLKLDGLSNLERFGSRHPIEFPKLRELKIEYCPALNNFVSKFSYRSNNSESTNDETLFNEMVTFSNLNILSVRCLSILRYLWHHQFADDDDSFSRLTSLAIKRCSKLSVVFPSNTYRRFKRLESLSLIHCDGVEEIYEYQGLGCEETNILQAFSLQWIYLKKLPALKHIFRNDMDKTFTFQNLRSFQVLSCPKLRYIFPALIACGLLHLEKLEIRNCGVEMIIVNSKNEGSKGAGSTPTFEWPKFTSLEVYGCDKLIKFSSSIPTQDSLYFVEKVIPNVEVMKLDHHSLKALQNDPLPVELLWKMKQVTLFSLQEESIPFLFGFIRRICSSSKLILEHSSFGEVLLSLDDEREVGDQDHPYHLRLKHLKLDYVHNLKHILKKDCQLQFLQTLSLSDCKDMMNIAPSSASFQNLTTLDVSRCHKMTSFVTASTAKSMIQLMELRVYNCNMLEEIVVNDVGGCTEHDGVIIFKKLKSLKLLYLDRLNSFCSGNYMFDFPLLEELQVGGCYEMKIFCQGVVSAPKLESHGNPNAIIEQQNGR